MVIHRRSVAKQGGCFQRRLFVCMFVCLQDNFRTTKRRTIKHNFDSSITHLQNALQQISTWMSANLLTLNSSKTEFLLVGIKKQLDKIHNSTLNTTHSARNLVFIFDEQL